jgi:anhydro-N-acetylmuramic acid kinase
MVYPVIGLMSGTSLDGLDITLCQFSDDGGGWSYQIVHCETLPFPASLAQRISVAHDLTAAELVLLDRDFGKWCGEQVLMLSKLHRFQPMLIGSHGHTVYHQPAGGITLQIGHGDVMAKVCGFPVVYDFRTADIALGGEGAPLVPVGDRMLFGEYAACLNLGGIANISYYRGTKQTAYDICPANMVLNALAMRIGFPFDKEGAMASSGKTLPELEEKLNRLPYYSLLPPKSLSREMIWQDWMPLLSYELSVPDLLRTFTEHIARLVSIEADGVAGGKMLVTGGGAFNRYLLQLIINSTSYTVDVQDPVTVSFKEALIFGFLGLLRWKGIPNISGSVTGASRDHCSGLIAIP